jgi:hypothetical protein
MQKKRVASEREREREREEKSIKIDRVIKSRYIEEM